MKTTRREAIRFLLTWGAGTAAFFITGIRTVGAAIKRRVLPKGTPMHTLVGKNPARLDATELEVTPLEAFGTMGQTNFSIAAKNWRLSVEGDVGGPLKITYADLTRRPAFEREVLLICPGFFAFKGRWKGISVAALLREAQIGPQVSHVLFSGPTGVRERSERFSLEEIETDRVFLAYEVNGVPLPQKHGFPLRLVAEDHYGARWVKYVDRITAVGS